MYAGLGNLLLKLGWIRSDHDWQAGKPEDVMPAKRPREQRALLIAWVRSRTALDFAYRGTRTERGRKVDQAVADVKEAARLISDSHSVFAQYAEAPEAFMDDETIHNAKRKARAVGVLADHANRVAAFTGRYRGVDAIVTKDDFEKFTVELTVLLPGYGPRDRDIAEILFGSRSEKAVQKVRWKRYWYKRKRRNDPV